MKKYLVHKKFLKYTLLTFIIFFFCLVQDSFAKSMYQRLFEEIAPKIAEDLKNMSLIPEGKCEFGSMSGEYDEIPIVTRNIKPFYIDKHEITNKEFKEFLDANPQWNRKKIPEQFGSVNYLAHWSNKGSYPSVLANHPVINTNWFVAKAYCLWKGKRLPRELEWEKAAAFNLINPNKKKKHKYKWSFGDKFEPDAANTAYFHGLEIGGFWPDWWSLFKKDLSNKILKGVATTPVGAFRAGCNNLHDMTGNVWEWCDDVYEGDAYKKIAYVNSMGSATDIGTDDKTVAFDFLYEPPHSGKSFDIETQRYRVVRGGSWVDDQEFSRASNRFKFKPEHADNDIGFRCTSDVVKGESSQQSKNLWVQEKK